MTTAPQPTLPDLLSAPVGSLRVDDVHMMQRLAREELARAYDVKADADFMAGREQLHRAIADKETAERHERDRSDAARMREVDALVGAGMVDRLASWVVDDNARHDPKYASWAEKSEGHRDRVRSVVGRVLTAFAAALLTDGAVEAFDNGYDNAFAPELDRFRAGIRAAIRAAGMEPVAGVAMSPDAKKTLDELTVILSRHVGETGASEGAVDVLERKLSELKTERARADKAHDELVDAHEQLNRHKVAAISARDVLAAERACADQAEAAVREWQARAGTAVVSAESLHDELRVVMRERNEAQQVAAGVPVLTERANKAEADLAALETVIAETAHAAGISGTMTPAARVRAMGATLASLRVLTTNLADHVKQTGAEADALRAEVAALRGLASHAGAIDAAVSIFDFPSGKIVRGRMIDAIGAALSVVPASSPAAAPKPESPGLEALPLMSTYGVPELRAITARVNVLSAIVKRGGL